MPAIEVWLPTPPSVNHLFANVPKRGRVKTKKYSDWFNEAGRAPLAGEWKRFEDLPTGSEWELHLVVYGLRRGADLSNHVKAVEDLVCAMSGLQDRYVTRLIVDKRPPHDKLGRTVQVWAATTGRVEV